MSAQRTVKPLPPWLDRLINWGSDRMNPMLIRCVRQELRSRTFIAGYILALAVAMVAALITAKFSSDAASSGYDQEYGRNLFFTLFGVWSFILIPVQAIIAFRTITVERQHSTWDLVDLTGMPPGRVVRGLLLTTIVQSLLYTTALAPYMMLAYLLQGIDLLQMIGAMVLAIAYGTAAAAAGALAGTLTSNTFGRGLFGLGVVGMSFGIWLHLVVAIPAAFDYFFTDFMAGLLRFEIENVVVTLLFFNIWGLAIWLCLVLSTAQLTHRANDRSSGPRTAVFAIVGCGMLWMLGVYLFNRHVEVEHMLGVWSVFLAIAAGVLGFFSTTEDLLLSPRQASCISETRGLRRLRMRICGPGGNRGHRAFLLLGGASVICALIYNGIVQPDRHGDWEVSYFSIYLCSYAAALYGLNDWLSRSGILPGIETPLHRRSVLFALIMASCLLPLLLSWVIFGIDDLNDNMLVFFSPLIGVVTTIGSEDEALKAVWGVALVGLIGGIRCAVLAGDGGLRIQRIKARQDDPNPRGG